MYEYLKIGNKKNNCYHSSENTFVWGGNILLITRKGAGINKQHFVMMFIVHPII